MKKAIFLWSFVVSVNVLGMTNVCVGKSGSGSSVNLKPIEKNNLEPKPVSQNLQQDVNRESLHSRQRSSEPKDQNQKKKQKTSKKLQASNFLTPKELGPQTEEKIEKFVNKLRKKKGKTHNLFDPDFVKKVLIEYSTQPNVSIKQIAENNGIHPTTLFNWKTNAGLSFRKKIPNICTSQAEIDLETREKIRDFSENGKHRLYSAEQIEEALIDWVTKGSNESNEISYSSLVCWSQELGIASIRKDILKKSREASRNLINSLYKNIDEKANCNTHRRKQKFMQQMWDDLRKKEQIEISQSKKEDILNTYRKGLFTKKGLAEKFKIKESDLNFIIHEARKNEKDLSRIRVTLSKYLEESQVSETTKKNITEDYKKGLLSLDGISVKYNIHREDVKNIIFKKNMSKDKRGREGNQVNDSDLIFDLKNRSFGEIKEKYGYKFTYVDDLKRHITHWEHLTDDQRRLFKTTMDTKIPPTKDVLSSIKSSPFEDINEKFKKLLFVLISTRKEVTKKYNLSQRSVYELRRDVNLWKALAREM